VQQGRLETQKRDNLRPNTGLHRAGRLDDLRTLAGQIRTHFYKITLPWSDEGHRLLTAHFYFDLSARMREFEQSFLKQVDDFLDFYPSYIEHVRPELNGLFREEDYPLCGRAAQEVRPEAGGAAHSQRRRLPRHHVSRGTGARRPRDRREHTAVARPESRFHASLVTNVFDLVDLLPQLNVGRDQGLNHFATEIRNRLCAYPAHDLKKSDILRVATASDAAALPGEMDAVMQQREQATAEESIAPAFGQSVDDIISHMSAYEDVNPMNNPPPPAVT
jgi:hypothetical protein